MYSLQHLNVEGYGSLSLSAVGGRASSECHTDCCTSYFLSQRETLPPPVLFSHALSLAVYAALRSFYLIWTCAFLSYYRILLRTVPIQKHCSIENTSSSAKAEIIGSKLSLCDRDYIRVADNVYKTWMWLGKVVWQTGIRFPNRGRLTQSLIDLDLELKALCWQDTCHRHLCLMEQGYCLLYTHTNVHACTHSTRAYEHTCTHKERQRALYISVWRSELCVPILLFCLRILDDRVSTLVENDANGF